MQTGLSVDDGGEVPAWLSVRTRAMLWDNASLRGLGKGV